VFRGQFFTEIVDIDHGLCVKERVKGGRGTTVPSVLVDNHRFIARLALRRLRRVLTARRS
jgi:hypothetical protein